MTRDYKEAQAALGDLRFTAVDTSGLEPFMAADSIQVDLHVLHCWPQTEELIWSRTHAVRAPFRGSSVTLFGYCRETISRLGSLDLSRNVVVCRVHMTGFQ